MTDESKRDELLEIYKRHAELAGRVSQRREAANQRYASMLAGLGAFLAFLLGVGDGDLPAVAMRLVSGLGMVLSLAWYVVIRSYRQLNTGKLQVTSRTRRKASLPLFQARMGIASRRTRLSALPEADGRGDVPVVDAFRPICDSIRVLVLLVSCLRNTSI